MSVNTSIEKRLDELLGYAEERSLAVTRAMGLHAFIVGSFAVREPDRVGLSEYYGTVSFEWDRDGASSAMVCIHGDGRMEFFVYKGTAVVVSGTPRDYDHAMALVHAFLNG